MDELNRILTRLLLDKMINVFNLSLVTHMTYNTLLQTLILLYTSTTKSNHKTFSLSTRACKKDTERYVEIILSNMRMKLDVLDTIFSS